MRFPGRLVINSAGGRQYPAEAPAAARPNLDQIFQDHAAFVMRVVRRMGTPAADVEDVAQEVFVVIHRRLSDYDPSRPLRPWIFGIASRTALAHRRKVGRRRVDLVASAPAIAVDPGQEQVIARKQARALLDAALDALDADKRSVFVAYDLEGMSMKEIAEAEGCPLQTAYSRLHAARRNIRAFVEATSDARETG